MAATSAIATFLRITGNSSLTIPEIIGNKTRPTPVTARPKSSSGRPELSAEISAPRVRHARPAMASPFFQPIVSPRRHRVGTKAAPASRAIRLIQIAATALIWYDDSSEVSCGTSMLDGME